MKTILKTTFFAGLFTLGFQFSSQAQQATLPSTGGIHGNLGTGSFNIYNDNSTTQGPNFKLFSVHNGGTIVYSAGYAWDGMTKAHEFQTEVWQPATSTWLTSTRMVLNNYGNVGIGTETPFSGLHIANPADWGASLWIDATSKGGKVWGLQSGANWHSAGAGGFSIRNETDAKDCLLINGTSGLVHIPNKLRIGSESPLNSHPDYDLSVTGKIVAKSIYVTTTGWADYVFADDYKLTPLSEVEAYVKENKHLPEIPSTQEVMKNGIDVASMDALLLKKVEELTLHMIELMKQNEQLKNRVQTLEMK